MKVILLSDVKKVGKKGDTIEVADGYGRNFLLRRNLAVIASEHSLNVLEKEEAQEASRQAELQKEAQALAAQLEKIELEFPVKAKDGMMSGSVSTKQIVEALRLQGIHVDKRKILDHNPIQSLGYSRVRVELYKNVIGTIRVKVVEE